jgi:hypothetical protein
VEEGIWLGEPAARVRVSAPFYSCRLPLLRPRQAAAMGRDRLIGNFFGVGRLKQPTPKIFDGGRLRRPTQKIKAHF